MFLRHLKVLILKNMKFSIVTPSYNQGQFIEETMKSVLSQEGDFEIEYIIADGGSTDNTVEVIKKYDKLLKNNQYPVKCKNIEFRWWSEKDKGQSDAINQGFKIAKGDFLAWINSDDYYKMGAFQAVISEYKKDMFDLIYGDCVMFYTLSNNFITPKPNTNETYESLLTGTGTFGQPATFFTKEIAKQVGYLDESLHYCMDYDFWVKIFKIGKIKYLPSELAVFRIWENSKTTTSQKKFDNERNIIARRYGGNIFTPRKVNLFIDTFHWRHYIKEKFPSLYFALKSMFFNFINLFKYRAKR